MHVSKSTPLLKRGYWEETRPESEDSVETRRIENWTSFEELIIPNRTRLPSWNQIPQPKADDFQVAMNLLRLQSSKSSLAPSTTSHRPSLLSHKLSHLSALRKSSSSPSPSPSPSALSSPRGRNPSIRLYRLHAIHGNAKHPKKGIHTSKMDCQSATADGLPGDLQEALSPEDNPPNTPAVNNPPVGTRESPRNLLSAASLRLSEQQLAETPVPSRSGVDEGTRSTHGFIQNRNQDGPSGNPVQSEILDEKTDCVNDNIGVITKISNLLSKWFPSLANRVSIDSESSTVVHGLRAYARAKSSQTSLAASEKLPVLSESTEEQDLPTSSDSIRPVSVIAEVNKSKDTTITRSQTDTNSQAPEVASHVLNVAAINRLLGTDPFIFPLSYGPTTLRLNACLVPLFREIAYEYAQPNLVFARKYKRSLVNKYCSFWIAELQQAATLRGTVLERAGTGPSKVAVIKTFRKTASVTECGAALVKLLKQLTGGILGNITTLRHLASLLQLWRPGRWETDEALAYDQYHKPKAIACYLLSLDDSHQRDLIIAVFSLCSILAAGEKGNRAKSWILASVFAPLLLNGGEHDISEIYPAPKRSIRGVARLVAGKVFHGVKNPRRTRVKARTAKLLKQLPLRAEIFGVEKVLRFKRTFRRRVLRQRPKIGEMTKPRRLFLEHFVLDMILVWRDVTKELKKVIESAIVVDDDGEVKEG